MQQPKVEWLRYGIKEGDWRLVELAVDGKLASFSIHEADWRAYPTEAARNAMLLRNAQSMIEELGDFRYPKPESQLMSDADYRESWR